MCEYFVKADPIQYEQRTRSVRIRGMLTSIRLENTVWDVLADTRQQVMSVNSAIEAQRDFWLAETDLQTTLIGMSVGSLGQMKATAGGMSGDSPAAH